MTHFFSSDGLFIALILVTCISAYLRRIPRIDAFLTERRRASFWSLFYKLSVVGIRLHWLMAILCVLLSIYLLLK